jgi:hypothetical protein
MLFHVVCFSENDLEKEGGTAVAGALWRLTALHSLDLRWIAQCCTPLGSPRGVGCVTSTVSICI